MAPERCLTFSWFSSPDLFGSSVGSHQKSHWPLQEKPWSHKLFLALQSELQKWKECLQISTLAFKKKFNLVKSITEVKACSHKHIESSNFILAQNISVKARELQLLTKFFTWYSQSFVKLHCNHYYYNLVYNISIWHTQMFLQFPLYAQSFIVSRLLNLFIDWPLHC